MAMDLLQPTICLVEVHKNGAKPFVGALHYVVLKEHCSKGLILGHLQYSGHRVSVRTSIVCDA
jgi:hypothetical protein